MLNRRRFQFMVVLTATLAMGLLGTLAAPHANAQEDCGFVWTTGPNGDEVLVWTCSEDWQGGGGNGEWTCHIQHMGRPMQVPCIQPMGWFTTMNGGCYIMPIRPQPPAGDPRWGDNDPADGVLYMASCFAVDGVDGMPYVHLPIPVFLTAAEGVIGDLIERAIALLPLRGADIHMAPDPSGVGLVGLPVWMWTPQTGSTWGPLADSLTALGVTVNVEANADRIRWQMGDGTERICSDPGTPYHPGFGAESAPCGHTYHEPSRSQPDGRYVVTAITEWHIDWEIAGTAINGVEVRTRESSTTIRINELQVVTS